MNATDYHNLSRMAANWHAGRVNANQLLTKGEKLKEKFLNWIILSNI